MNIRLLAFLLTPRRLVAILLATLLPLIAWNFIALPNPNSWTEEQRRLILSLSLDSMPVLPADPSNRVADSELAASFGQRLFFDTRLSGDGSVACATCHRPELMFTDGLELAIGVDIGPRHTPSLVGLSYSPWYYWDGRKDSQWSQALAPLEAKIEHGSDRNQIVQVITKDPAYRAAYREIFGELPALTDLPLSASPLGDDEQQARWNEMRDAARADVSRVFSNLGKALAAYQRRLMPGFSAFDHYAATLADSLDSRQADILRNSEIAGLRLFIGRAQCINCHNGPLFSNHEFHNTGVLSIAGQLPPMGRYDGIRLARRDPFNCLGEFSDAAASECIELRFARDENDLVGAQKTPTLRNLSLTAPYMHGGQITSLEEVIRHYNDAPVSMLNHNEAKPLGLRPIERRQLQDFLLTLNAPLATDPKWLMRP